MNKLRILLLAACVSLGTLITGPVLAYASAPTNVQVVMANSNNQVISKIKSSWPWYITRASGLIAAITLTLLLVTGIGAITGYTYKFLEPLTAWATHRALGIAFGVSVLVHVTVLLFDKFQGFSIIQILVPFSSKLKPATVAGLHLGSLYVAFGILAFYLVAIVVITSLLWVDKKPYTWRLLHYLSYLIIFLIFFHSLFTGTDLAGGFWRFVWIAGAVLLLWPIVLRLKRVGAIDEDQK